MSNTIEDPNIVRMSTRDAILAALRAEVEEVERLRAEIERLRAERDALKADAERYRWLAGHCPSTSEHWGGRWSIIIEGPCPTAHDSEDAFDAAIDAARSKEQK